MGRGDHAADKDALREAQDQKQDRRDDAGLGNGRQQAERGGADADAHDRDQHRTLAAVNIGVMAEYRGAHRTHQQRHREGGVDRRELQRRDARREEQRTHHGRDVQQDEQVEQVKRPAEYRRHHRIACVLNARRIWAGVSASLINFNRRPLFAEPSARYMTT